MGLLIGYRVLSISLCLVISSMMISADAQDTAPSPVVAGSGEAMIAGRIESDRLVECSGMDTSLVAADLDRDRLPSSSRAEVAWRIDFSYPDGSYDAEGVAVDMAAGEILILTKRDDPPLLFALPLSAAAAGRSVTAKRVRPSIGFRHRQTRTDGTISDNSTPSPQHLIFPPTAAEW